MNNREDNTNEESILCCVLVIGLAIGCGKNNETNNLEQNNTTSKKIKKVQLPGKYIFADYDKSFRKKEELYATLIYNTNIG